MSKPNLVSVVMSAYNEESYVRLAVESILRQTHNKIELIIIDDCSTDDTLNILEGYSRNDPRITIIRNADNLGLTKSLNIGLRATNGEFIARMDADDISLPTRLEKQLDIFDRYPQIVLCGTATVKINATGKPLSVGEWPSQPNVSRWYSVFRPAVAHPSAMFRSEMLSHGLHYDETLETAQDYDLWSRMIAYGDATVIPEPLLHYRDHAGSVSNAKRKHQKSDSAAICTNNLRTHFSHYFSTKKPGTAERIANFIHAAAEYDLDRQCEIVSILQSLEKEYLTRLNYESAPKDFSDIMRITVRWIIQAMLQQKSRSKLGYLRILSLLKSRIPELFKEAILYSGRRLRIFTL